MAKPKNPSLYNRLKASIKKKMKWPSAYASSLLQKRYKAKGGTYSGKPSGSLSKAISSFKDKKPE